MSKRIYSLQWSAVENAQTYRVYRSLTETGNKQELSLTSNTSFPLNTYIPGSSDYYYFIKAQATGYQDSDYSTPLRWKTFSISRSVDAGVIESNDDYFVGEGFGFNTGFVAPEGKVFNQAVCLLTIGGIQHPEYISFLTGDKAFNIDIPAEAVTGDIVYSAVVQDEITQLATPTIAMNADGKTLEIADVENATSYDVYVDGTLKTNVAKAVKSTVTLKATGSAGFVYSVDKELTSSTASETITAGRKAVLEFDTLPTYIEVCPPYYNWDGSPTATGASVNSTSRKYGSSNQTIYRITNITNGAVINCTCTD